MDGSVDPMMICVQGSYVEALLESSVIVYVKMLAQLQYAWTLTMTQMAMMETNVIQMQEMSIAKDTASVIAVSILELIRQLSNMC